MPETRYQVVQGVGVRAGQGRCVVEYDQPSSLFGQFGREDVTNVALSLDKKLEQLLAQAAELSRH